LIFERTQTARELGYPTHLERTTQFPNFHKHMITYFHVLEVPSGEEESTSEPSKSTAAESE